MCVRVHVCECVLAVKNEEHSSAEELVSGPGHYQLDATVKAPSDKLMYNSIRAINML